MSFGSTVSPCTSRGRTVIPKLNQLIRSVRRRPFFGIQAMRARISSFYLPLALICLVPFTNQASAEFRCNADISYRWVKRVPEVSTLPAPPVGGGHGSARSQAAAPTPLPPKPTPEPTIVRLIGVERSGEDEATAKANLQVDIDRHRIRASEACKRDHESYGTCVALKMSSNASVLNSLGFSARADLEKALNEECRQQEGTCLGVDVSESKCREIVAAKPSAAPEGDKADASKAAPKGGKDPKKK